MLSLLIGYPVAYFTARHAGRWRALVLLALILPFWINYLMRMLAWINLLSPDGCGTRFLHTFGIEALFESAGPARRATAAGSNGQASSVVIALVYGYIPFLILPLYAALDRIDQRHDRGGARPRREPARGAFRRVTLPLSVPGILAGVVLIALPMFGDYYTHGPGLGVAAHEHDRQPDRPVHAAGLAEDHRRGADAAARGGRCSC